MPRTLALLLGILLALWPAHADDATSPPAFSPRSLEQFSQGDVIYNAPVPSAPASHVLDQAGVILPEVGQRLSARLVAARTQGVQVYVATIPTLGDRPSKQSERLEKLATKWCVAWTPGSVGALLLFDDESGLMTVVTSKEAEKRFTTFLLEKEFREALATIPASSISREKLERSAEMVTVTLCRLEAQAAKAERRQFFGNLIMGVLALIGVGLAIFSAVASPKTSQPAE